MKYEVGAEMEDGCWENCST